MRHIRQCSGSSGSSVCVCAIATLSDLLQYLHSNADAQLGTHFASVAAYRDRYGV